MSTERCEIVVMGGGPGGTASAIALAKLGHDVVLLEREHFPRFRIGESLLPAAWELWERLGVTADVEAVGFPAKRGVSFTMPGVPNDMVFLTAEFPQYFVRPYTFHVERSRYDQVMLDASRRCGVDVREGWSADEVTFDGGRATGVRCRSSRGDEYHLATQMVVDATGRSSILARQLGRRRPDPALNKIAHFRHYHVSARPRRADDGSYMTDIHTFDGGWLWYIPLADDLVSVGTVLDSAALPGVKGVEQRFARGVECSERVHDLIGGAPAAMPVQTISNVSYLNDCFVGDGLVMVGDAAMFVDPIFSAGVTLAMRGGIFAADAIHAALDAGDTSAARLAAYEQRIRKPMGNIFRMIYNWYRILSQKNSNNNVFVLAQHSPLLRERLIVLLSGGYEKIDLEPLWKASPGGALPADAVAG